ncbi:MAG TPA: UvrB/UvrC motif-containing protein [Bryobacteraceae bacterium]|nr:UvrB/UvrC motif-containing protein [Bryobacteraceae bacterium]
MESLAFDPADAKSALTQLPQAAAVFALYGEDPKAEPYIGRTPNLRGRLERLLQPSAKHPRRLQLAGRVRRIAWRLTGSEFESLLTQFSLLEEVYGEKALERMHLRAPAFIRYLGGNRYPRIVVTNRPSQREADWAYGPFASRAAAERFAEEALKLFLLRRCVEELDPDPSHPGCVYSEMKMCLAPCYKGCTDERYAEEAGAVEAFLATRGESKLVTLRAERETASENLEFEQAAALHAQVQKVESVRALAPELVQPLSRLRAVVLQTHAVGPDAPSALAGEVSVFLYEHGTLRGPASFSTLGMRIQNERSGSSSLFAQPVAVEAVPEIRDQGSGIRVARNVLESRMEAVLAELAAGHETSSTTERQGHLALLKRWYYRPEVRRVGEIFFPDAEGRWPLKAMLRGVGRIAARTMTGEQAAQPQ